MTVTRGYGTAGAAVYVHSSGGCDEELPLLRKRAPRPRSRWAGWRKEMMKDVSHSRADVILLLCFLVTGLLDSASIQVWGTFVSMQTGNSVYVGLGLASLATTQPTPRLVKSSISIASFCLGSFVFGRLHAHFSPKRRWVLITSFAMQALLTLGAAALVTLSPPTNTDTLSWNVVLPIVIIAFQSCGQAVASRALKHDALISVVLTSIYLDLFADRDLFHWENKDRDRRAVAPFLLIGGAVVGGYCAHHEVGIAGALWAAGVLKLMMVGTWLVWPAEEDDER